MNYIIDGFNLGYKIQSIAQYLSRGDTEDAIPMILNFIQGRCVSAGNKTIIVFDGRQGVFPDLPNYRNMIIKFSRAPQKADDIIRTFLRNLKKARSWTLVSSDLEIIRTAKDMGARVIKSENFITLDSTSRKEKINDKQEYRQKYDPNKVDMDYWLKQFGEDKDE